MTLIQQLASRGVRLPSPETIYIAPDVNPERIAADVTIHPGCRLSGAELSIGPGCVLGAEAPATVADCQLGGKVHLAGGFFDRATFLDGFKAGSGAHVRPGCLFEEGSSIAHSVGVKQTVFLPWVTAGSLINFCDCLMAGGTGRKDHSEIGSSYIHFNFTPHQDKATASLIGDVPRGALLNQPPIFLGGQGGLVGPAVIEYGTVIPAGQVWRGDVTEPGRLVAKPAFKVAINTPYDTRQYPSIQRVIRNNLRYVGNMLALDAWYRTVRARFMLADPFGAACHAGALKRIAEILDERLARLDELARKIEQSLALEKACAAEEEHRAFVARWPAMKESLTAFVREREALAAPASVAAFVTALTATDDYLKTIQSLSPETTQMLTEWLGGLLRSLLDKNKCCYP